MLRMLQSAESLVENKKRNRNQRRGVHQSSQHSGTMVAVGFGGAGRARLQIDRDERKQQREKVGKIVSRLRKQRQRVGANAGHHQQPNIGQRHGQGNLEHLGGAAPAVRVNVHISSLSVREAWFKGAQERGLRNGG